MDSRVFSAAKNGDTVAIENLYAEKPEIIREVTFEGNNILHIAAREGHYDLVAWILNRVEGSSMCLARNTDENTPLHEAAQKGDANLVRLIIASAESAVGQIADTSSFLVRQNKFGETPLLIACKYGHKDAARALEATVSFKPEDQPYLQAAAYGGHLDVLKLLLSPTNNLKMLMTQKDGHGRCGIHAAVVNGSSDIIDAFMSSTPDCIEIRSADRKTVLHFAVTYNRLQLVKKLLCDEKKENAVMLVSYDHDAFGNSALHMAAENAVDPELVQYLLSFPGVNVNAVNNEGLTPLDIAVAASSQKSTNEIIRILKEAGASASFTAQSKPPAQQKETKDNKAMEVDPLVASLVATVTFAAIFQIPGGIQDDKTSVQYGAAKLALRPSFLKFLVFDTLALFTSLIVVFAWILRARLPKRSDERSIFMSLSVYCLEISIVSTGIAFISAVYLVTIPPNVKDLKTTNKEDFHNYQTLCLLLFLAVMIPVIITAILSIFSSSKKAMALISKPLHILGFLMYLFCCGVLGYEARVVLNVS